MATPLLSAPLQVFDQMFDDNCIQTMRRFRNLVKDCVENEFDKIPLLCHTPLELIPDGHLVCVQGMVQDTFNIELFVEEFDHAGLAGRRSSLCYRDYIPNEVDDPNALENIKFGQRQSFYVVPVPGETPWVREVRDSKHQNTFTISPGGKRASRSEVENLDTKKSKCAETEAQSSKPKAKKQFPLSEEESDEAKMGVLVRIYDQDEDCVKLNDLVMVYGILEHARLASLTDLDSDNKGIDPVPRVHAVFVKRMYHNNPLLSPLNCPSLEPFSFNPRVRASLIAMLTECFAGDVLAAEYTLLHLLSSRFKVDTSYPSTLPAVNIIGSTEQSSQATSAHVSLSALLKRLRELFSNLVTQLVPIEVSLDALNTGPNLIPTRDAAKGSLDSGRLQLARDTQVLADETHMSSGQLQSRGCLNLRALTLLATERRVPYDFQFYTLDFDTDSRMLIVSSGPSLIKPTFSLPWVPNPGHTSQVLEPDSTEADLSEIRKFLTLSACHNDRFTIDDAIQKQISEDFVNWRRDKATFVEATDFSIMLVLLRSMCLSHGQITASLEHWHAVCALETQRRARLPANQ